MRFYLHIGYPKTASTFLQDKLFKNIKDIYYAGTPFSENLNLIFKDISLLSDKAFKRKKKYLICLFQ